MKSGIWMVVLMCVFGISACIQHGSEQNRQETDTELTASDDEEEPGDQEEGSATDEDEGNETEIALSDLPQPITDAIAVRYPDAKLREADKILNPDSTFSYDVEMEFKGKVIELMFDPDGKMLGEETEDD